MSLLDVIDYLPTNKRLHKPYRFFLFAGVAFGAAWIIHQAYSLPLLARKYQDVKPEQPDVPRLYPENCIARPRIAASFAINRSSDAG